MKNVVISLLFILFLWGCSGKTGIDQEETESKNAAPTESVETIADPISDEIASEAESIKEESEKLEQKADSILNSI